MMTKERTKELLEKLVDVVADEFDLDATVDFMKRAGFTKEEMKEIGCNLE